jgi:hypothetical protein
MKRKAISAFVKCNFRLPLTVLTVVLITVAIRSLYALPIIDRIGNNVRSSFIALGIIFAICFFIVLKLVRDLLGILLFNKSERSVINKSSIKK